MLTIGEDGIDASALEGGELEIHFVNGELQLIAGGIDLSHMINRVSWFWMKGHAPRISLDISEISTLDMYQQTASASFRRNS